jgi:hypothetical protein
MTSRDVLTTAEVAYQRAQEACYEWTVAQASDRVDRDILHAAYLARWNVYLRLLQWAVALVHAEHGIASEVRAA